MSSRTNQRPRVPAMHRAPAHMGSNTSARQDAIATWLMTGVVKLPAQEIAGILPKAAATPMAEEIEKHFTAAGIGHDTLLAWWRSYQGGMKWVRLSPAYIPFIVDALIGHLRENGHA